MQEGVEQYKCVNYSLRENCIHCDSLGRGIEDYLETNDCYNPRLSMISCRKERGKKLVKLVKK